MSLTAKDLFDKIAGESLDYLGVAIVGPLHRWKSTPQSFDAIRKLNRTGEDQSHTWRVFS